MELSSMLRVPRGVTAILGGGGKTTLMYTLAREKRGEGVIITTSTHIRVPEGIPLVTEAEPDAIRGLLAEYGMVCAGTPCGDGKLSAPLLRFEELTRLAPYVLVEADGSRGLPLKAHAAHEPVLPENTAHTIYVLGADGFDRPIREVCHRPALYAALAGVAEDDPATPAACARVLAVEGYGDMLFVNKAEDARAKEHARALAGLIPLPAVAGSLFREEFTCLY